MINMLMLYLLINIYFILMDELLMASAQRRIGPYNMGGYGIMTSMINGCNLILTQVIILKLQFNYWFQLFPILFLLIVFINYGLIYPFLIIDIIYSLFMSTLLSSFSIILIMLSAYSCINKYSMLGSIRLITQLMSFELMFTTIVLIIIYYFNSFIIIYYHLYWYWYLFISIYYLLLMMLFLISLLADCNRTPFDLPEAESELVAGFITEFSSIYFSFMLLTDYGNIICLTLFMFILFNINFSFITLFLLFICLISTSFNSVKFDELMINAWTMLLPFVFMMFILLLL